MQTDKKVAKSKELGRESIDGKCRHNDYSAKKIPHGHDEHGVKGNNTGMEGMAQSEHRQMKQDVHHQPHNCRLSNKVGNRNREQEYKKAQDGI